MEGCEGRRDPWLFLASHVLEFGAEGIQESDA